MHLGQTCSPIISGPVKIVGYELLDSPRQAAKKAGSKAAEVCTVELSSICLEEKANEERAIFWGFLFVFLFFSLGQLSLQLESPLCGFCGLLAFVAFDGFLDLVACWLLWLV
jgi:hypothetical protein